MSVKERPLNTGTTFGQEKGLFNIDSSLLARKGRGLDYTTVHQNQTYAL